jgi:ArsR family transcriptional regulator
MDDRLIQEINLLHEKVCLGIGDPKRIMILYELSIGPRKVNELANALGMPQPTVSRHLRVLRERSIVLAEREGASITYSLAEPRVIQALDLLREVLQTILQHEAELAEFIALEDERS